MNNTFYLCINGQTGLLADKNSFLIWAKEMDVKNMELVNAETFSMVQLDVNGDSLKVVGVIN